jgi:hypothetical protein
VTTISTGFGSSFRMSVTKRFRLCNRLATTTWWSYRVNAVLKLNQI